MTIGVPCSQTKRPDFLSLSCAITKVPCLHFPTLQTSRPDNLRVAWYEVNGLVTPLNFVTLNVQDKALDWPLDRKLDRPAVRAGLDGKPNLLDGWEVNELERLRPIQHAFSIITSFITSKTYQFEYRLSTEPSPSSRRAETMIVRGTSLAFVLIDWPGSVPFHNSVLAFAASVTSCENLSVQFEFSSNEVTSSVAFFSWTVELVPQISISVVISKAAADRGSGNVFLSLRVMPTV